MHVIPSCACISATPSAPPPGETDNGLVEGNNLVSALLKSSRLPLGSSGRKNSIVEQDSEEIYPVMVCRFLHVPALERLRVQI